MTELVAAIDCGTNTVKLLVTGPGGERVREMRMVRLGEGVDRTGRLSDEALARTFAALDEYAALLHAHGVPPQRVRFCATSASRDAANADVFTAGVRERLGVQPEVVTGAEEAALAYGGAVAHLRAAPAYPVLVVDVGGGSTELVLGGPDGPTVAHSMDIGSVRLHERHLHGDPPTPAEVAAVLADVDRALDGCPVDPAAAATVVGVAGTVTTLAAGVLGLAAYDRAAIDQAVLTTADVQDLVDRLVAMPRAARLALPWLHPGRADVIDAGGLILGRVLERSGATSLVVSESDILDGIAASLQG
ncbi:exopolyphosphatase [Nocardioides rubriscoriae]|uniref:Ppx/GppA phosphatase family protein n=1 Tax=Nocardioides rubriscoriae TaxID=642762 RepID=UPI0011E01BEE|nr:exopolyphosphatase [Nocardioides rubriscoriae]